MTGSPRAGRNRLVLHIHDELERLGVEVLQALNDSASLHPGQGNTLSPLRVVSHVQHIFHRLISEFVRNLHLHESPSVCVG
jgi:hypothetical protein